MDALTSFSQYLAPLLVFGLVVFVHELGHFLAAKLMGVYAPVFSLGWGRRLFGWKRGETDYRVSMIPLGGYVRMATREDDAMAGIEGGADRGSLDEPAERPRGIPDSLYDPQGMAPFGPRPVPSNRWVESKSVPARVFILSAGVLMNLLLTLFVSSGIYYRYGNAYVPAVIDSIVPGMPAAAAGIQKGDRVVAIGGAPIRSYEELIEAVSGTTSGSLAMEVERGGSRVQLTVTPTPSDVPNRATGIVERVGRIGVTARDSVARESVGLGEALSSGSRATVAMARNVVSVLGGLVTGKIGAENLGGPIAIAKVSVEAAKTGAETLWSLIAFLSLNIAILNLVPIPVLDGGQILIVLGEAIKGSAFSTRTREAFARVGVLAVLALILLVTFNDLRSVITR